MKLSKRPTLLLLALATLALAGCGTLTPAQRSAPVNRQGAVKALPPIRYNSYCEAQKGIAAHNSRADTLRTGKNVTYKAPCDLPMKKPKANPTETIES